MAYSRYKKRKTRYRPRKKLYRRKAYRTKRRLVTRYRKKKSYIPHGLWGSHTARLTWSGSATVDIANLVNTVVHTFTLSSPWAIDYNGVTTGNTYKPSGLSDMLAIWREACLYSTFVKIEQEPQYTTNRIPPVYVFLRKKTGNLGGTPDVISNPDEMYREVNNKNIRIWGEVDGSWGQNQKHSKGRPLYMKFNRRKDMKDNPWESDNLVSQIGPDQNAYCHVHFMTFTVGGDPQPIRYRITVDMIMGFRGRRDGISQ